MYVFFCRNSHLAFPLTPLQRLRSLSFGYRRRVQQRNCPWLRCKRSQSDEERCSHIQRVWHANWQVYGAVKVWKQMHREGLPIARCTVQRLMRKLGIEAASGKDLVRGFSSAYFRHRCIANEIAIAGIVQGFRVSTEREISQGMWLGGEAGILGKRPDVVLRDGKQVIFCEVEKSRKKMSEYQALLRWLGKIMQHHQPSARAGLLGSELILERVIFICTQAFRTKLQKDLEAAGWYAAQQSSVIHYSSDLYMFRDILFP